MNGDFAVDVANIASVICIMAGDVTLGSVTHYDEVNGDNIVVVADNATIIARRLR